MKEIGKEFKLGIERENFLKDNADEIVEMTYMRKFSQEEMDDLKSQLAELDIDLNDIEEEKKAVNDGFKIKMKPMIQSKKQILKDLKQKAEFVKENVFKFINFEEKLVQFYNSEGNLIDERPAYADEIQKNIFQEIRKNGTDNQ